MFIYCVFPAFRYKYDSPSFLCIIYNPTYFRRQRRSASNPAQELSGYFKGSGEVLRYTGRVAIPREEFTVQVWVKPEGGQDVPVSILGKTHPNPDLIDMLFFHERSLRFQYFFVQSTLSACTWVVYFPRCMVHIYSYL